MKTEVKTLLAVALCVGGTLSTQAAPGDLLLRVGVHNVAPKSSNHPLVNVDDGTSLTLSGTYFLGNHVAVEVLGAVPFKHDINLNANGAKVAETTHLPPTVTLQYHFAPDAPTLRPYVGAGLNYTSFYDEKTRGALAGNKLSLDNSMGLAVDAGVDLALGAEWAVNLNIRWFDIDTDARLDGTALGTVQIDPWAYGLMFTRKLKR